MNRSDLSLVQKKKKYASDRGRSYLLLDPLGAYQTIFYTFANNILHDELVCGDGCGCDCDDPMQALLIWRQDMR